MHDRRKQLVQKISDYKHFIVVLLIVSSYLYVGAYHDLYMDPREDGETLILLSLLLVITSGLFFIRMLRLKKRIKKNEL
ncbi:YrhC family protein [Virgibacillus soli]|uniref:YrhC family protein n=1 Tax=Paracerasibacillus soli TaxID=480284 RepID=A0ABU5CQM0_9BACI|nr:YrhC family protein [Virgibacillus soli]MDY0408515.1 YrhC family protein [Virgibacillus soli]